MPGPGGVTFVSMGDFLAANGPDHSAPPLDPEVVLMRLREAAVRYRESDDGPRFEIGDIVTPVKDGPVKGHGEPQLVIENRYASPDFRSHRLHGERNDIRVLTLTDGVIFPHWGESAHYEKYTGPGV